MMMAKQLQNARDKAFNRQRGLCCYCRRTVNRGEATIEHRIPRVAGGNLRNGNAAMSCRPCNEAKGSMPEGVFLAGGAAPASLSDARAKLWQMADSLTAFSTKGPTDDK
jgi:hypothetical protein